MKKLLDAAGLYLQQSKKRIAIAFIAAMFANVVVTTVWQYLPVPHHVVRKLAGRVVQDFWTTNRYEVTRDWQYGVGPNSVAGMVPVDKTNNLW